MVISAVGLPVLFPILKIAFAVMATAMAETIVIASFNKTMAQSTPCRKFCSQRIGSALFIHFFYRWSATRRDSFNPHSRRGKRGSNYNRANANSLFTIDDRIGELSREGEGIGCRWYHDKRGGTIGRPTVGQSKPSRPDGKAPRTRHRGRPEGRRAAGDSPALWRAALGRSPGCTKVSEPARRLMPRDSDEDEEQCPERARLLLVAPRRRTA